MKLAVALFYWFNQEMRLEDWRKRICINQSRLVLSYPRRISKKINIISKYFCTFNNAPLARWVVYIIRDFLTCYSCSHYSSMFLLIFSSQDSYFVLLKLHWQRPLQITSKETRIENLFRECSEQFEFIFAPLETGSDWLVTYIRATL